ncbi:MAG: Zn-ribbon domain-containing OB-fold protein [Polyangiaceae bacterium]|nr:Zn-ribbon domain-containing OB-fold protein [Polyangiaceae bacterium]
MEVPRHWRTQSARYALEGTVCQRCGETSFPPRDLCSRCGSGEVIAKRLSGRGEIYSYSTVFQGPNGFAEYAPYLVALVRLAEGPLVAAQLTDVDPDAVQIGMPVEMVTRRLREDGPKGIVVYGYKFRPPLVAG